MDTPELVIQRALARQTPIRKAAAPGNSTIQKFYAGRTIFVTGGSGFLGKLFIEKICRTCDIKNIYMLIRPKKNVNAQDRLLEILKDPAFQSLHEELPNFPKKIITVEGDITVKRLGLSDNDWNTIVNEVDMIFHIAANVRFDVELKEAIISNVGGTREMLTLGKACTNLRAYVHVSTAYTFATKDRFGGLILEEFQTSPADPDAILEMAEAFSSEKLNQLTPALVKGWPNTYTFSKAIAEEAVRTLSEDLPICVVRPAIVVPTYVEPAPGWVDISNVYGPSGMILGLGMGVIKTLFANKKVRICFTPADLVTNAIIAAGWETGNKPTTEEKKIEIYTVSNMRKPVTWGNIGAIMRTHRYTLATPKALWYCESTETNRPFMFWLLTLLFHFVPAYLVDGLCSLLGKERRFVKLYKKMYKLTAVLSYFTLHDWQFSDDNTHRLYKRMSKADQVIFNFDIATVDWIEVMKVWWIGLRKYIIKDELKDTRYGNTKQKILCVANYTILALYLYVIGRIVFLAFLGIRTILGILFKTTGI
ncbi:unnamed protein product, partial [Iphiclides podalirius]